MLKEDKDFVMHLANQILAAVVFILASYFLLGDVGAGIVCLIYLMFFSLEK